MSEGEKILVDVLAVMDDRIAMAVLLQTFIQESGPLSEAAAKEVRAIFSR